MFGWCQPFPSCESFCFALSAPLNRAVSPSHPISGMVTLVAFFGLWLLNSWKMTELPSFLFVLVVRWTEQLPRQRVVIRRCVHSQVRSSSYPNASFFIPVTFWLIVSTIMGVGCTLAASSIDLAAWWYSHHFIMSYRCTLPCECAVFFMNSLLLQTPSSFTVSFINSQMAVVALGGLVTDWQQLEYAPSLLFLPWWSLTTNWTVRTVGESSCHMTWLTGHQQ